MKRYIVPTLCFIGILGILVLLKPHSEVGAIVSVYPNPLLTPGVVNPNVTQANINQTICVKGWTATVRPPSSYTTALKIKQIKQYGFTDTKLGDYEEDHFLSLEIGGSPTDPKNLWPESYPTARDKDKVENFLHKEICTGKITLQEGQREISTDWLKVLKDNNL